MREMLTWLNNLPQWVAITLVPVLSLVSALIVAVICHRGILKRVRRELQNAEGFVEPTQPQFDAAAPTPPQAQLDAETRNFLFEHHKAAYQYQLERTDKLRDRISFLSGLLTLLGGAIFYAATNYSYSWRGLLTLAFYVPALLSLFIFAVAVYRALYCIGRGFTYSYIPTPKQIQRYGEALSAYASAVPHPKTDVVADLKDRLITAYSNGGTYNLQVNTDRTNLLLRGTKSAIWSFIFLLLALPAFFTDTAKKQTAPAKVIISEPIKVQK